MSQSVPSSNREWYDRALTVARSPSYSEKQQFSKTLLSESMPTDIDSINTTVQQGLLVGNTSIKRSRFINHSLIQHNFKIQQTNNAPRVIANIRSVIVDSAGVKTNESPQSSMKAPEFKNTTPIEIALNGNYEFREDSINGNFKMKFYQPMDMRPDTD